jgi:hypothetical protein
MFLPIQTSLSKEHLKRHYRSLHTHDKPFECTNCSKKLSRSGSLGLHQCTVVTCMYDRQPGRYRSSCPRCIRYSSWGSSSTERLHETCTCRQRERLLRCETSKRGNMLFSRYQNAQWSYYMRRCPEKAGGVMALSGCHPDLETIVHLNSSRALEVCPEKRRSEGMVSRAQAPICKTEPL